MSLSANFQLIWKQSILLAGLCTLFLAALPARAQLDALLDGREAPDFLPVEQAFQLRAAVLTPDRVQLSWIIAPGYYLYRDRLKFAVESGDVRLGSVDLPPGARHSDEFFGDQVVYYGSLVVQLPLDRNGNQALPVVLRTSHQGCADAGLCYPPQTTLLSVQMPAPDAKVVTSRSLWLGAALLGALLAIGLIIARRRGTGSEA